MARGPIILPQPAQLLLEDDFVFIASKRLFLTNGLGCCTVLVRYRWMVTVNRFCLFHKGDHWNKSQPPLAMVTMSSLQHHAPSRLETAAICPEEEEGDEL